MGSDNNFTFYEKHIVVGGAATGIGRSLSELLHRLGANLILLDINLELLEDLLKVLPNPKHKIVQLDYSHPETFEEKLVGVFKSVGGIDGYVHCVGLRSRRPINTLKTTVVQELFRTNLFSFIEMVRVLSLKGNWKEGMSVVGISSIAAKAGTPGLTAYSATKSAMEAATRCLARELANKKIRLNTIIPGQVNTPAYKEYMQMSGFQEDPVLKRQYLGLIQPADVANVIAFLLGPQSSFISGAAIPVDGGFLST